MVVSGSPIQTAPRGFGSISFSYSPCFLSPTGHVLAALRQRPCTPSAVQMGVFLGTTGEQSSVRLPDYCHCRSHDCSVAAFLSTELCRREEAAVLRSVAGAMMLVGNYGYHHGIRFQDPAQLALTPGPFSRKVCSQWSVASNGQCRCAGVAATSLASAWAYESSRTGNLLCIRNSGRLSAFTRPISLALERQQPSYLSRMCHFKQVAQTRETVNVTENTAEVHTTDTQIGQTIPSKQVVDLEGPRCH